MFSVGTNRRNQANHKETIRTYQKQKNYRAKTIPSTNKGKRKRQYATYIPNIKKHSKTKSRVPRYKIPIKMTFWGGFAVDADFGDGFSGSIEGPKIIKNH
jgi:hypothetical protein